MTRIRKRIEDTQHHETDLEHVFLRICTRLKILLATVVISSCTAIQTPSSQAQAISDVFRSEGVVGTFIAASVDQEIVYIYNEARALERFSPASTFKIPNTLIALDEGIVVSKSSKFEWDGTIREIPGWNKDQTLETAFKASCVWCYQEIARKVGVESYEEVLGDFDYGNQSTGLQVDSFWLNGDLKISAIEQMEFLRKLRGYELPIRREHVDILKEIMLTRQTDHYSIYAKSGWGGTTPQVGWYVGFVESDDEAWIFAMNIRVDVPEQVALRQALTIRSLQALDII